MGRYLKVCNPVGQFDRPYLFPLFLDPSKAVDGLYFNRQFLVLR
jgi:hypothetical protein